MNQRGWIYFLENPSLNGLVKIGFSTKEPEIRVRELSSTGVPRVFEIGYEALLERPRDLEQRVHATLKSHHENKEFFRTTPKQAIAAIRAVAKQMGLALQLERTTLADDAPGQNSTATGPPTHTVAPKFLMPSQVRAKSQLHLHQARITRLNQAAVNKPRPSCPHSGSDRAPTPSGHCSTCFGHYS